MKLFLLGVLGLFLVSCSSGGGGSKPTPPSRPLAKIGYGVPNFYHQINPDELGDSLVKAGLGLTVIEYMPWFTQEGGGCKHNGGLSTQIFPAEAARFVDSMRKRGILTVVMGINANNCGVKKSGWGGAPSLLQRVLSFGTNLVWYLPVNEPWTASASLSGKWNNAARAAWTGHFLVADKGRNNWTGNPHFGVPHDLRTVNACNDGQAEHALRKGGPQTLVTTDCTGTLNPGPDRARRLAGIARETGVPFVVYDFRGRSIDHSVIAAMGG